jgi:epoxyqueuosine reductase
MNRDQSRRNFIKQIASAGLLFCFRPLPVFADSNPDLFYKYSTLPIDYLPKLNDQIQRTLASGAACDNEIYRSYVSEFQIAPPENMPNAKSVILVAVQDPIIQVDFNYKGTKHRIVAAPGYTRLKIKLKDLGAHLRANVTGNPDTIFEYAYIPAKLMAARTGLAQYGKNNICFVPGMGSYMKLLPFFTDHDFGEPRWHDPIMLHHCKGCDLCIKNCPGKCIVEDRFVIDAGKCVTLYNELADPFPDWIPPHAHNALAGCMMCQDICPANKDIPDSEEYLAEITETETEAILSGITEGELIESVIAKIGRIGLTADMAHLSKNLQAVLVARQRPEGRG